MNWQAISFDWNQVRAFLATADTGSLSAAARALGLTQPTLSRQVTGLETDLGVTLFERRRRGLILTRPGQELLDHVRDMGEAATRLSLAAEGQNRDMTGSVSITAVDVVATHALIPVLRRLRRDAPGLTIQLIVSSEIQDLTRRDADIALRHTRRPTQPDLVAKRLADFHASFYAAPAYLDRVGRAKSVEDLSRYDIVGVTDIEEFVQVAQAKGIPLSAEQFVLPCNSGAVVWDLVRAGLGISMMPDEFCEDLPEYEKVLDGPGISFPVWLTTHRELHTSKRIRLVFDAIADAFRRPRASSGR